MNRKKVLICSVKTLVLQHELIYDVEMPFCSLFADTREDWPSKGAKNLKMMMMTTAILIGLCL